MISPVSNSTKVNLTNFFWFLCTFWSCALFAFDKQVGVNESNLELFPEHFSTNPESFTDFEAFLDHLENGSELLAARSKFPQPNRYETYLSPSHRFWDRVFEFFEHCDTQGAMAFFDSIREVSMEDFDILFEVCCDRYRHQLKHTSLEDFSQKAQRYFKTNLPSWESHKLTNSEEEYTPGMILGGLEVYIGCLI